MRMDSGTSWSSSGLDKDAFITEGLRIATSSAKTENFEAVNYNEKHANLSKSHHGNGAAVGADERETDPLCTPKFGVPGSPAECLTVLELPEDLSCSHDSASVGPAVEGDRGPSSRRLSCTNSETLAGAEVITCSPLELDLARVSESDFGHPIEMNEDGKWKGIERTVSFDQAAGSPSGVAEQSPGHDCDSVAHREISGNGTTASSKADNVAPGSTASQRVVSTGSSKRLVFQRVDDLWEKSRPNAQQPQPQPNSRQSSSWNYKDGEIDEDVLSELPKDIQHELRNQLRRKRPKSGGRSTISDFFKTNSSAPKK